jgi:CubicO group peptidase (beta-lactamase class C family)
MLQALAAAGIGGAAAVPLAASARAASPSADWSAFDRQVQSAFDRMRLVGGAVAVVSSDKVLHTMTLGSRALQPRRPVTELTRFRVGSTTKSMTSAFVATYVDEGKLAWDQPVIDAWSGFRAPTDELTRTMTVRQLLNMASGLGDTPGADLHLGVPTPEEVVRDVAILPVLTRPGEFFYNNTANALGGYLPLLVSGVALGDLGAAYTQAMKDRIFAPAGMTGARIADDPRGLADDYSNGHVFDLRAKAQTLLPFGTIGAHAPAGSALASLTDMTSWVRMQLRQGRSVTGKRVVTAANLAECWKGSAPIPFSPNTDPDGLSQRYGMGWQRLEFKDGTILMWHNGAIEGFTSYMAFLPQHDLGLVVLNNMNIAPTGIGFYIYVVTLLLNQRFGLNQGVTEKALEFSDSGIDGLQQTGRRATRVDWKAVAPYLGYYADGYSLTREGADVVIRIGSRVMPLAAMPDGTYVVASGLILGTPVKLAKEADATPHLEIVGVQTVRRTAGLA